MRWLLCLGLMTFATAAFAQEQEGKLVDRLLRPNMQLSNSAQDKKFNVIDGTSVDKKFVSQDFYAKERPTKTFWGSKSLATKSFSTGKFSRAEKAADAKASAELAYASTQFQTQKSSLIRESSFARKKVKVRDYADNRPFLAKGTRQKILDQQHKEERPMTIEEVRELLNKNR